MAGAGRRPLARRPDLRHRRLAAKGAHRHVLLAPVAAQQLLAVPATESALNRVSTTVPATRAFFDNPKFFTGQIAFSNRAIGNFARPYYPDGEVGRPNGPLSPNIQGFSPFSTGLQSDLVVDNVIQHVRAAFGLNADTRRSAPTCRTGSC
jgi:hypothetical protein